MELPKSLIKAQQVVRAGKSTKVLTDVRLPKRYHGKALIPNNKAHQEALKVIKSGESLFLTGPCGNGKTHLAIVLMQEWFADTLEFRKKSFDEVGKIVPAKGNPIFLLVTDLLLEIKESWRDNEQHRAEGERHILEKYAKCPFLVLDDLGAEKPSEWSRSVLQALINKRYLSCSQTIVTSNLSIKELAEFDDRISSRLNEMGEIISLGKKDWRVG